MLPNFGAMQEGLGAIAALVERIAVALERIAYALEKHVANQQNRMRGESSAAPDERDIP